MNIGLDMITIYKDPKDFPGMIVTRWWFVSALGGRPRMHPYVSYYDSVDEARADMPCTAVCIQPDWVDDPCIVETWIDIRHRPKGEVMRTFKDLEELTG